MTNLVGRRLGKYLLDEKLGEGGMAAVFRSRHPQFDRPVAIKILPPVVGQDASFRARFEREGRMIAGLNHPHIIRVYDIDEADGLFYMVMDLLPGGTLESRIRQGGLDRTWSAGVVVKVAEALEYAHSRGIIHRDIKPSNILLDADGQPILADFGIARLTESDSNLTAAGTVMGTPAYMAPEQLTGEPPDARSDIYSLGVVLYQLLAGRAPFTGNTTAIISAHLTQQPPSLRQHVPDLPPALDAVVLQALAKQPEHRFKSAGVFAQALRNAATDLEPALVRVASAAPDSTAPTFSDVSLPRATSSVEPLVAAQQPFTTGQKVARYLPVALGVFGLLLLISIIAKYWALVVLLLLLIGSGGFMFMYLRASAEGRRAAAATTRAITTSTRRVAPPDEPPAPTPPAPLEPRPTRLLDDDVPEVPLVPHLDAQDVSASPTEPTQAAAAWSEELPPTEVVPTEQREAEELPPTEVVPTEQRAEAEELPPTEVVPTEQRAEAEELPPTEVVPTADQQSEK